MHYTALGQLRSRTDNKGQQTTFNYDLIGRMEERIDPSGTSTWTWDTAANGIGKLNHAAALTGSLKPTVTTAPAN